MAAACSARWGRVSRSASSSTWWGPRSAQAGRCRSGPLDRCGTLTSNVSRRALQDTLTAAGADPSDVVVTVAGVVAPLVLAYSDAPPGEPCALLGSSGRLEFAVNGGSAAAAIPGAARGAP